MKKILSLLVVLLTTFSSAWADDSNLLPGRFSVSATKQVQFTKSNLYWDGSTFKFEANQTDYPTAWNANHVSHFFWTKTAANSYAASYSDGTCTTSDNFFCGEDNKMTVDGTEGLYALTGGSSGEWYYLFNSRTNANNLYKNGVTVTIGDKAVPSCLVIAPDDYTGTIESSYDATAWATAEAAGLVCLPATGRRDGSVLDDGGDYGNYWSATPKSNNEDYAYRLLFSIWGFYPTDYDDRSSGYSLRLVKDAEKGTSVNFAVPSITMDALAEQEVKINLSKVGKALSSLQMNITLPDGTSYVDGSAALGTMADDAELSFKKYEDTNKYNVQILSNNQNEFTGDDSDILTFKIKANKGGITGKINLTNIIGSTTTAEKVAMPDMSADITVNKLDPGLAINGKGATEDNRITIFNGVSADVTWTSASTGEVSGTYYTNIIDVSIDDAAKKVTLTGTGDIDEVEKFSVTLKQAEDDVYKAASTSIYVCYLNTAVADVIEKINAIGTVEFTDACKAKIDDARSAYDALNTDQQKLVTNYQTLLDAEERYLWLRGEYDHSRADKVIDLIDQIGTVEYTHTCYSRIYNARSAYNNLTYYQQELVTNYQTLVDAEVAFQALVTWSFSDTDAKFRNGNYNAGNITYTRSGSAIAEGNYATFCLPMEVATDNFRVAYLPLEMSVYDESSNTLMLFLNQVEDETIPANTPFLAELGEVEDNTISIVNAKNTYVPSSPATVRTTDIKVYNKTQTGSLTTLNKDMKFMWTGTLAKTTEVENCYLFRTDGSFTTAANYINPFRAYLKRTDSSANAKDVNIVIDLDDDAATGIFSVDADADAGCGAVYSLDGKKMGTSLKNLPKGIYIVNGRKLVR